MLTKLIHLHFLCNNGGDNISIGGDNKEVSMDDEYIQQIFCNNFHCSKSEEIFVLVHEISFLKKEYC